MLLELVFIGGPAIWLIGNAISQWQNWKHVEHSRKSTHYYFDVSGWPDPRVAKRLEVNALLYDTIRLTPACAHVEWHAGSLGDPWISSLASSTCGDLEK